MRIPEIRWHVRPVEQHALDQEIPDLARQLAVPPLVARLMWLRGLRTESRARSFLRPRMADLSPPEGLPNLEAATDRLARVLRHGERVAICGDYDVDGMTGTALLVRFLRMVGGNVTWSIPDREKDGYGLTVAAVERLAQDGVSVAVTVDNGVTALEPIRRARELGIDVIITDHHLPGSELPPAYAIVNPHLIAEEDASPAVIEAQGLCGCGLAFKLAWAVADRVRGRVAHEEELRAFLRDAIGLTALATVADVVPLLGENRILVAAGLGALRKSSHPGIRALLDVSGVEGRAITTEDVAFKIAPRLNAGGRLSRPHLVVDLLTSEDEATCRKLAHELDAANRERRRVERGVLKQAEEEAARLLAERDRSALVLWGEGWHVGVVGIVAARLVDKYARPAAVIGFAGGLGRGSCRTPAEVNVHAALATAAEHLQGFGGHAAAAGLDIRLERASAFRDAFERAVDAQRGTATAEKTIYIDAESDIDDWNLHTVQALRRLGPFGKGNPEPLVVVRGARVAGTPKLMGAASTHLSFALKQREGAIRVVGFRRAALYDLVAAGRPLDLVAAPVVNEWRGIQSSELRLEDVRESAG